MLVHWQQQQQHKVSQLCEWMCLFVSQNTRFICFVAVALVFTIATNTSIKSFSLPLLLATQANSNGSETKYMDGIANILFASTKISPANTHARAQHTRFYKNKHIHLSILSPIHPAICSPKQNTDQSINELRKYTCVYTCIAIKITTMVSCWICLHRPITLFILSRSRWRLDTTPACVAHIHFHIHA